MQCLRQEASCADAQEDAIIRLTCKNRRRGTVALRKLAKDGNPEVVDRVLQGVAKCLAETDVILQSVLITACAECGDWQLAMSSFRAMQIQALKPDDVSCNSVMQVSGKSGSWEAGATMMESDENSQMSSKSLRVAIALCGDRGRWAFALSCLNEALQKHVEPSLGCFNAAIAACRSCWTLPLQLLAELHKAQVKPDLVSCNAAIATDTVAGRATSTWTTAVHLLTCSMGLGLQLRQVSFCAAINACTSEWKQAVALLRGALDFQLALDHRMMTAALMASGLSWKLALRIWADVRLSMRPDVLCLNSVLKACTSSKSWHAAARCLYEAVGLRLKFDEMSFNTVAGQSLRPMGKGSWQSADVRNNSGLKSLEAIGSSCMRACAAGPGACNDAGHWKLALAILSSMTAYAVDLSRVSWNTAIASCQLCSQWQLALSIVLTMQDKSVRPDSASFASAICCCAGKQWRWALRLWHMLRDEKTSPNQICLNSFINVFEKSSSWKHAVETLRAMPLHMLTADDASYNSAVAACQRRLQWHRVLWTFHHMDKSLLDEVTYNEAVSAAKHAADWPMALALLQQMKLSRLQPFALTHEAAVTSCLDHAQAIAARTLLEETGVQWLNILARSRP
ncbi:unnamed protein product [Symbiodinium natans]|uniref:Pentatricopeptide repeat-containing protein, chloroplastic n=1 Tax=Symbiodinium natans TaxID=878477 RepID=A0A812G6H5_9DINO|nr:unnamed protein product [Symbiodinium natans]